MSSSKSIISILLLPVFVLLFPIWITPTMSFRSSSSLYDFVVVSSRSHCRYRYHHVRRFIDNLSTSSRCIHHYNRHYNRHFASLNNNNDNGIQNQKQQQKQHEDENDNNNETTTIFKRKYEELMDSSKLSLAPMMEYTDRHFRHLVRLVSSKTLLYSEMVAANALCHERRQQIDEYISTKTKNKNNNNGDNDDYDRTTTIEEEVRLNYNDEYLQRFLCQGKIEPLEGPSVLQLGGSDPKQMYEASQTVIDLTNRGHCDYTAINLNCGCPSPKVAGKGCFGAALMDDPKLVADLTRALHDGCDGRLPISVKCRIGTDSSLLENEKFTKLAYEQMDPELEYTKLCEFIETVASNGIVTDFSVHARIAVLSKSFSPADNRKIPPLKYDIVHRLVEDYPQYTFTLNGGIDCIPQAQEVFDKSPNLNGVMIGRSYAADPWSFAMADQLLYDVDNVKPKNRLEVLTAYGEHADKEESMFDPMKIRRFVVKAVTPLFTGEPNAKKYRIALDEIAKMPKTLHSQGKSMEGQPPISELILNAAYDHLSEEVLLRSPEESYERVLFDYNKNKNNNIVVGPSSSSSSSSSGGAAIAEWNSERRRRQQQQPEEDRMISQSSK